MWWREVTVLGAFYRAQKGGERTGDDGRWWSSLKSSITRGGAESGKGATQEAIRRPEAWDGGA
jgi:hypothetical protein